MADQIAKNDPVRRNRAPVQLTMSGYFITRMFQPDEFRRGSRRAFSEFIQRRRANIREAKLLKAGVVVVLTADFKGYRQPGWRTEYALMASVPPAPHEFL
jgi:hypothetical protein